MVCFCARADCSRLMGLSLGNALAVINMLKMTARALIFLHLRVRADRLWTDFD